MKSINLQVDEATLAKAEESARQNNTSIDALLRDFLNQLAGAPDRKKVARQRLLELSSASGGEVGPRTWRREDLYDR